MADKEWRRRLRERVDEDERRTLQDIRERAERMLGVPTGPAELPKKPIPKQPRPRQNTEITEPRSVPAVPESTATPSGFSATDFVMFAVGGLIAEPLCHAGWDAIVTDEHVNRGIVAIAVGLLLGGGAGSFHWWKNHVSTRFRSAIEHSAGWWLALTAILLFIFFVGPELYTRAITANEQASEAQKSTLTAWLQQAQGERDQARRDRDQARTSSTTLQAAGTVAPAPTPPSRFYSPKQKGEVAELIQDTSALIDKYSETIRGQSGSIGGIATTASQRYAPPVKERVATSLRAANTLMETAQSYLVEIQNFERDHAFYRDELNFLGSAEIQRELATLKDAATSAQSTLKWMTEEIDRYPDDRHLHDLFLGTTIPQVKKTMEAASAFITKLNELKKRGTVLSQSISQ